MKSALYRRVLAVALSMAMLASLVVPAAAAGKGAASAAEKWDLTPIDAGKVSPAKTGQVKGGAELQQEPYGLADILRVSIVLESDSTLKAGFEIADVAFNKQATSYRAALKKEHAAVTARIEKAIGSELDVKWNLTLAANLISANVKYGDIETIKAVEGVAAVEIENRYEPEEVKQEADAPHMGSSSSMIGSNLAWQVGYTGAGSKVAIIDTGIDPEHQSFDGAALEYALQKNAEELGIPAEEYLASLDLLTAAKVEALAGELNVAVDPAQAYLSAKLPFAYNYIDETYTVDHAHDTNSEHGSHVAGIAAANKYIPQAGDTFVPAMESVLTQGVAPDAQILVMKVFGVAGGAYDSDYMAAIEDAIVMGADSVNLSLGSSNPGLTFSGTYESVMNMITEKGSVVSISAGNSGHWNDTPYAANFPAPGYLYLDDVSTDTLGSPGSYPNALTVASADNDGVTGMPIKVGDAALFYNESAGYGNEPLATLAGEQEYILIDGFGTPEDFAPLADVLAGKIAVCSRGVTSFFEKANAAVENGAIATIIYNNTDGVINMNLTGYTHTAPAVSVTMADGDLLRQAATPVSDGEGAPLYYAGTLTISEKMEVLTGDPDGFKAVSSFSSWGVSGSLTMKPEITAPGGSIYAVNGYHLEPDGVNTAGGPDQYELMSGTSMAAPQVAGMAAVLGQYVRETGLAEKTGLTPRQLINSLLMSTAVPMIEDYGEDGSGYYPVLRQGAGLGNVGKAISARSYILMGEDATLFPASAKDGKVKAELGDDPDRTGHYTFSFTVNSLDGEAREYTLSTDLFTQGLFNYYANPIDETTAFYMDTQTMELAAEVTYTVGDRQFTPVAPFDADVNGDGVTDAADAQTILNYLAGSLGETDPFDGDAADADWDGSVTTRDAYYILSSLKTEVVSASEGGSFEVTVDVQLDAYDMFFLDHYYTNGAYLEGFTYVTPVADEEGVIGDVEHSIPILGFYGNWSDPSMFDNTSVADVAYGTDVKVPYTGCTSTNGMYVRYGDDTANNWFLGNPYMIEDAFPADRLAVNDGVTLYQFRYNLIRNAGTMAAAVTDAEGKVLWLSAPSNNLYSAFYHVNQGVWQQRNTTSFNMNKTVASLGLSDGDVFTVGLYAVPEYYAVQLAKENGAVATGGSLTADELKTVIESGVLGRGASITYTVTLDNQAPAVAGASRDLITDALTVTAQDDNYVAYVAVMNQSGSKIYAEAVPEQTEANQVTETVLDLGGVELPDTVVLLVADYAGNETAYEVQFGGEKTDRTGMMIGFTAGANRGGGNRWITLDPETVYYVNGSAYGGTETYALSGVEVRAAEYVDGYVFMAAADGNFYAAPIEELDAVQKVASIPVDVYDMAYSRKDNVMYLLSSGNQVYVMDLVTGELTFDFAVTVQNPRSEDAAYRNLVNLAVDGEGNFYGVCSGSGTYSYLFKWSAADVSDYVVVATALVPTDEGSTGYSAGANGGALAWDSNTDTLYWANNAANANNLYLLRFDLTTGKAVKTNTEYVGDSGANANAAGRLAVNLTGLFIISDSSSVGKPTDTATSVTVSEDTLYLLKGQTFTLTAEVFPWTLTDKSVTWSSDDESVVTVENGVLKAVDVGTATVTVTTAAEPHLTATCSVEVEPIPVASLNGLIYAADGTPNWCAFSSDAPEAATVLAEGGGYISGGLFDDVLYVCSEDTLYAVDADSFEVTNLGEIASDWIFSDAVGIPAELAQTYGGKIIGLCSNGKYLETLDPEKGSLSYWDLTEYFGDDPMAAIAYGGLYPGYVDEEGESYDDAFYCFLMTESGTVYTIVFFGGNSAEWNPMGETGIALGNVSANADPRASLVYDEGTGYLFLANYREGDTAQLYAVNPFDPAQCALIGEFGESVWPAVALYQYTPATDLVLKVNPTDVTLYESGSLQLKTKVKLGETNAVTYVSDDENVATVDENGLITAVAAGTATVTVTTVDVNSLGDHLTATVTVTVKEFVKLDKIIRGQVTTVTEGNIFADITLTGPTAVKAADAPAAFQAGARLGDLYLANVGGQPLTLDAETLEEVPYFGNARYFSMYPPMDMANYPTFLNEENEEEIHHAFYVLSIGYLVDPDLVGWNLSSYFPDMAGLAYGGYYLDDDDESETYGLPIYVYYMVTASGMIYELDVTPATGGLNLYGILDSGLTFEQDGVSLAYLEDFSDPAESIAGLVLADNATQNVYFIDLMPAFQGLSTEAGLVGTLDSLNLTGLVGTYDTDTTSIEADPGALIGKTHARSAHVAAGRTLASLAQVTDLKATKLGDAVNAAVGSANRIRAESVTRGKSLRLMAAQAAAADGDVTLTLSEDTPVTNGLIAVQFDSEVLTFAGVSSDLTYYAAAEDSETPGVVYFAYANDGEIAANTALATLSFNYVGDYVATQVDVYTLERNGELSLAEAEEEIIEREDAHTYGEPVWTWTEENTATAAFTCVREDDTQILNAAVTSETTPATCTADGQTVYTATVEFEGKTYTDQKTVVIPATGHHYGAPEWQWAPDGSMAVATFTCEKGDDVQKLIAAVTSETVPVTHLTDGQTVYTATVTFEGTEYTDTFTTVVSAEGHVYGDPVWTWTEENTATAVFTCGEGDDTQTLDAAVTSETTEATCTADGKTVYTATVEFLGETYTDQKTVVIPAAGHSYGEPVWQWAADGSMAVATFTCEKGDDLQKIIVTEIALETVPATNLAEGKKVYTATVEFEGETYVATMEEILPVIPLEKDALDEMVKETPDPVTLEDYTDDSVEAYRKALEEAKKALEEAKTQEELDAAAAALAAAEEALTLKPVLLGDVDGDGKVTSTDARLTLQYTADKIGEEDLELRAADVDGDGKVTSTDARLILQHAAGKLQQFPVEETPDVTPGDSETPIQ